MVPRFVRCPALSVEMRRAATPFVLTEVADVHVVCLGAIVVFPDEQMGEDFLASEAHSWVPSRCFVDSAAFAHDPTGKEAEGTALYPGIAN